MVLDRIGQLPERITAYTFRYVVFFHHDHVNVMALYLCSTLCDVILRGVDLTEERWI